MDVRLAVFLAAVCFSFPACGSPSVGAAPQGTAAAPTPFEVTQTRPDHVLVHLRGGIVPDAQGSERPPLERTGLVRGRVVDADGQPVAGAVVVGARDLVVLSDVLGADAGARTDADGSFSIDTYESTETSLVALHHDGGMSSMARSMAGQTVELRLEPFAWIEGSVRNGADPVRTHLKALSVDAHFGFVGETDASGHYKVGPVPPGDYGVSVFWAKDQDGVVAFPEPQVRAQAGRVVVGDVVETEPGSVEVAFHRTPGMPVSDAAIAVFDGKPVVNNDEQFTRLRGEPGRVLVETSIRWKHDGALLQGLPNRVLTVCARSNLGDAGMHVGCDEVDLRTRNSASIDLSLRAG